MKPEGRKTVKFPAKRDVHPEEVYCTKKKIDIKKDDKIDCPYLK